MFINMILRVFSSSLRAYWFIFYAIAVSLMIYASFYVFYLPASEHELDVHLQYKTDCKEQHLCSFPTAQVSLHQTVKTSKDGYRVLTRGQAYDVVLELDIPLSDTNKQLGMFLIQMDFLQKDNKVIESHSRSALVKFQSNLLSTMSTIFYIMPLLTGFTEERQTLVVPLVENFVDDSYKPVHTVNITIHSKKIQVYSAKLIFKATFTGVRYYMHNWPVTFSVIGFFSILGVVTLVLIYRLLKSIAADHTVRDHVATTVENYGDLSDSSGDEDVETVRSQDGRLESGSDRDDTAESETDLRRRRGSQQTSNEKETDRNHLESFFGI